MRKKILVVAAALLVAPMMVGLAQAKGGYLIGKVGAYLPDESKMSTGFNGEVGYGFDMLPWPGGMLALEGTVGYFNANYDDYYVTDNRVSYRESLQGDVVPLALSLKAGIESGPFTFYVGGGVDLLFVSMERKYRSYYPYWASYSDTDNDAVFGGHVMAGATFDLNSRMFVGLEAKYLATQDMKMSFYGSPNVNIGDLNGVTVSGLFGFRF